MVQSIPAQISQERQRGARRRQFGNKGVLAAARFWLRRARCDLKISGSRIPNDYRGIGRVDPYGVASLGARSPEVATVNQRVTGRIELRDKCIADSAQVDLKRPDYREIRRLRETGNIDVSCTVEASPNARSSPDPPR